MHCINQLWLHPWPRGREELLKIVHKGLANLISILLSYIIRIKDPTNSVSLILIRCFCVEEGSVLIACLQLAISASLVPHFLFDAKPPIQLHFYCMDRFLVCCIAFHGFKCLEFILKGRYLLSHMAKSVLIP